MRQTHAEKQMLNTIGKFGVISELLKRNHSVSMHEGKHCRDVVINSTNTNPLFIKVKTSRTNRFVTNFWQRYSDPTRLHPDYWIIVHIDNSNISHYHIIPHNELGSIQKRANGDAGSDVPHGCDNVTLKDISKYENRWDLIKY